MTGEQTAVVMGGTHAYQVFGTHFAAQGYGRTVNMASLASQNGGTATGGHYAFERRDPVRHQGVRPRTRLQRSHRQRGVAGTVGHPD